jgi:hypothetical protein
MSVSTACLFSFLAHLSVWAVSRHVSNVETINVDEDFRARRETDNMEENTNNMGLTQETAKADWFVHPVFAAKRWRWNCLHTPLHPSHILVRDKVNTMGAAMEVQTERTSSIQGLSCIFSSTAPLASFYSSTSQPFMYISLART